MSGIPTTTMTEARGGVALPSADVDKLCIVIGPSSTVPTSGLELSVFFSNSASLVADRGYGDAVDVASQIIEETQTPVAMYTTPSTTAGSYGAIDNTSVTGTALFGVDAAVVPRGTFQPRIKIITGGTLGVSGITFQWALDGEGAPHYSNTIALGTGYSYTIPNSGVKFTLEPPAAQVTAYVTYINAIRTAALAHFPYTTGTVHGAADTTSDDGVGGAATNVPTGITLSGTLLAALVLHFARGSTVHLTADVTTSLAAATTAQAAAVADPTAQNAITVALLLETALETHEANLTYHTVADAVNVVSATQPTRGTLIAGDIGAVRTFGPKWGTAGLTSAFTAIKQSPYRIALIAIVGEMDASEAATVKTGLDALALAGKRVTVLAEARMPDFETSESDTTWNASVAADWLSFTESRMHVRTTYGLLTDVRTGRQYRRTDLAQFAADVVRVARPIWPDAPADQAMRNFLVTSSAGALVGHDEGQMGASTGLSNDDLGNRFGCVFRDALSGSATACYSTVPWVMFDADEDIKSLPVRRVVNAIERSALAVSFSQLGGTAFYTPADATNNLPAMLLEDTRSAIHSSIFAVLNRDFRDDIQNFGDSDQDTGLVQVSAEVTVTGGNLVSVPITLRPQILGFLFELPLTLSIKQ